MSKINPKHYELEVKGHKFEVADLMEAHFAQDVHLGQAIKYILRAGKKTSSSYIECVNKCLWWCARAIHFHGGTIDLPASIPATRITLGGKQITVKRIRSKDQ